MRRLLLLLAMLAAPAQARTVTATVYDPWYNGRPDACTGRPFQFWGISAAHAWLPCGTRVRVTHQGRSLVVPITDRCDCQLDLSAGAAHRLGVPIDGIGTVRYHY